jgi:hypothetical protein
MANYGVSFVVLYGLGQRNILHIRHSDFRMKHCAYDHNVTTPLGVTAVSYK